MQYANDQDGNRTEPTPGAHAICPNCGRDVFSKCGDVRVWHWTHKSACTDAWKYEPMSQWHLDWQNQFPKEWQEVYLNKDGEAHRADVLTPNDVVIEFQNSPISRKDIEARERFWPKMMWVVNWERLGNEKCIVPILKHTGEKLVPTEYLRSIKYKIDLSYSNMLFGYKRDPNETGEAGAIEALNGIVRDIERAGFVAAWSRREEDVFLTVWAKVNECLDDVELIWVVREVVQNYFVMYQNPRATTINREVATKMVRASNVELVDHFIRAKAPVVIRNMNAPIFADTGKDLIRIRKTKDATEFNRYSYAEFLKKYRDKTLVRC